MYQMHGIYFVFMIINDMVTDGLPHSEDKINKCRSMMQYMRMCLHTDL